MASNKNQKIIICGLGGIGKSIQEVISLSKHENLGVELIEFNPEKSELKELADQLISLSEREIRVMQDLCALDSQENSQEYFIPSQKHTSKGHQRPYKFHK